jgi:hypothetical protein
MLEIILEFLTNKHTIIVGAAATVAELIVIIVNLKRRLKPSKAIGKKQLPTGRTKTLLWAANPFNLFKGV